MNNNKWARFPILLTIVALILIMMPQPVLAEPDCAPTGIIEGSKWIDVNGDGKRESNIIQGKNPDIFFVMDISGSTVQDLFIGQTKVGDRNADRLSDTILDAEIAGFQALNQELIKKGFGDKGKVSLVYFADTSAIADLDPVTEGVQAVTTPKSDRKGNGKPDIEQVLTSLKRYSGGVGVNTNFEAPLQDVLKTLQTLKTPEGEGNVIFLSDGKPNRGGSFDDEVRQLRERGVHLSAFGVGENSSLPDLKVIDPHATIFTNPDELLSVFGTLKDQTETTTNSSVVEPGLENVTIYLDLNQNEILDFDEPVRITNASGGYRFTNLKPGTYTIREVIPEGYIPTTPTGGKTTVTLNADAKVVVPFGNQVTVPDTIKLIHIDAKMNNKDNPIRQTFPAGIYRVSAIGPSQGGIYEAWNSSGTVRTCDANSKNCDLGWETRYYFSPPFNKVVDGNCDLPKYGACRYDNPTLALQKAPAPVLFTLNKTTEMLFYIEDTEPNNNAGGLSLKVERLGTGS